MSAWKSLSDELDPDVRTFTERLRLVIDRSGLGVVAVAERTGHDRADWDAYLHARGPVPRSAVVALSDVTGADLGPLTAHWEHADRAWKRTLRERAVPAGPSAAGPRAVPEPGRAPAPSPWPSPPGSGAAPAPRPSPDPAPDGVRDRAHAPEGEPAGGGAPEEAPADRTMRIRKVPPQGPAPRPAPAPAGPAPGRRRRATPLLYAAGIAGAALVVTAALLLVDLGGSDAPPAAAPTTPAATTAAPAPSLPEGVSCTGADCGGRDPESMGCGGPLATTVARTRVGSALVEVRHSAVCAAAWARITGGAEGDEVSVQAGTAIQIANVEGGADTDAYTPMIPVASAAAARACASLSDGGDGCTGG
ncbi:DUF2690 domain-containing protein [Streptomyces omiyaensis]|uniref:DUF2690 domain-containing protein n=1 Tax=Streptomyces omiyaensis TaxID=68247 RepID=A0ABW7BM38_9ACTN